MGLLAGGGDNVTARSHPDAISLGGRPFPLGAYPEGGGVRFAVASGTAEQVDVCLISGSGSDLVEHRIPLTERTFGIWHGVVHGVLPGQRYGYRTTGPYDPSRGLRHNPAKLLVDPYARRITGRLSSLDSAFGYTGDPMTGPPSQTDSAGRVPLSVVTSPGGPDTGPKPDVPFEESLIYELHVRGFTRTHPDVPPEHRGTYLGLAHPAVIEHLTRLSVTAVELMPVNTIVDEPYLIERGRRNYWGYSPLGFFAPSVRYASEPGKEVEEFRTMVASLHAAGIEVILDVVFNHTCEGGVGGPTLSFRGLDGPAYYLHGENGGDYDLTGTGNTLDTGSPTVVRMVTDALRYWSEDMGVDGFRFDLASVLGRPHAGPFDPDASLLTAIVCDPVLATCKLIAEPWDATGDGYRVGGFGPQWAEWNDRFRDGVRDFWRGMAGVRDIAYRLSGSSDLYAHNGRRPWASINLITAHDGFTLRDLVSYNEGHRADGSDGSTGQRSWNCGAEGETDDPDVRALRARQARNMLATMLLSTGTPMVVAGDEMWRTQGGDDNPYWRDDETSWVDWSESTDAADLLAFTRQLTRIRADSPALRQPHFFEGRLTPSGEPDVMWFRCDGSPMNDEDWFDDGLRTLGMWIDGSHSLSRTREGELTSDNCWLAVLHAGQDPVDISLPPERYGPAFEPMLTTHSPDGTPEKPDALPAGTCYTVPPRTVLLFRAVELFTNPE
jgi:glycogen operon protein